MILTLPVHDQGFTVSSGNFSVHRPSSTPLLSMLLAKAEMVLMKEMGLLRAVSPTSPRSMRYRAHSRTGFSNCPKFHGRPWLLLAEPTQILPLSFSTYSSLSRLPSLYTRSSLHQGLKIMKISSSSISNLLMALSSSFRPVSINTPYLPMKALAGEVMVKWRLFPSTSVTWAVHLPRAELTTLVLSIMFRARRKRVPLLSWGRFPKANCITILSSSRSIALSNLRRTLNPCPLLTTRSSS